MESIECEVYWCLSHHVIKEYLIILNPTSLVWLVTFVDPYKTRTKKQIWRQNKFEDKNNLVTYPKRDRKCILKTEATNTS